MATINLSDGAVERLLRRAKERGQSLEAYLESIAGGNGSAAPRGGTDYAAWKARFDQHLQLGREWAQRHMPLDHHVDDSRESIYDARGE